MNKRTTLFHLSKLSCRPHMMQNAIRDFPKQFTYEPTIEYAENLGRHASYILVGMGGSHLAADILKALRPELDFHVHTDYGLPQLAEKTLRQSLIIASSYSGNTEEVIDAYNEAKEKKLPLCVVAVGGKLIDMAVADHTPYIRMPDTGIQPRSALGFSLMALVALVGEKRLLAESKNLARTLDPVSLESQGNILAQKLNNRIPVMYASRRNLPVAYNWKIKLNETGKIPAFYNVFPELNHNEMTGFDVKDTSKHLSEQFLVLLMSDADDHPQIQKRMDVVARLYEERGMKIERMLLTGNSQMEKIFTSLLVADWTAVFVAENYGLESEQVPMVEEFKKMIRS